MSIFFVMAQNVRFSLPEISISKFNLHNEYINVMPFKWLSFTHGNILGVKNQKYGEICFKIRNQDGKTSIPYAQSHRPVTKTEASILEQNQEENGLIVQHLFWTSSGTSLLLNFPYLLGHASTSLIKIFFPFAHQFGHSIQIYYLLLTLLNVSSLGTTRITDSTWGIPKAVHCWPKSIACKACVLTPVLPYLPL